MALCSSTRTPLTQFSKHVQDDRGLHIDRFASREGRERHIFRSTSSRQHEQAGLQFNQFSSSYCPPLDFASPAHQVQQVSEIPRLREFDSPAAGVWLSEYQTGSFGSGNIIRKQNQTSGYNATSVQESTRSRLGDISTGYANSTNRFVLSRPAFSTIPQQYQSGNLDWKQTNLTATQSIVEESLEKLDWENLFASLETRVKTDVELLEDPANHQNVVTTQEELAPEIIEVDKLKLLKTHRTDYRFQDENPFCQMVNPFEEGMRVIEADGNLSVAALAFEAACDANPAHFEAWKMLGSVLSEVERENTAIEALNEALKLDSNSLNIIMRLAISYTNEGASSSAYQHLEKWITTKYPQIIVPEMDLSTSLPTSSQLLDRIKEPFLQAARLSVTSENDFDPDVQVGLGVLLFSAKEFQLAADCFSAAIQSSVPGALNTESQLHLLWNRYGACLGNMDRYNEAVEAYEMALAIRPNFVRARYNLGLLYYNKNEPLTAAKTVLEALIAGNTADSKARAAMLKVVKVGTSHGRLEEIMHHGEPTSMYDMLRKCCGSLLKWDLMELIGPNMDLWGFQQELDRI